MEKIIIYGGKAPWPIIKGLVRDNRPVWYLEEAGLSYERISLDPLKGENRAEPYAKLNPFHKVPTLVHGDFVLKQSAAILHHLASTTGKLYPKDPLAQAKHLEWLFYSMTDVEAHATQIKTLLHFVDEADHAHAKWLIARAETILTRALDYLEGELEKTKGTFLMGDEFYAADVLLGAVLYPIYDHALVKARPRIRALLDGYFARPAFQRMLEINGT